MKLSVYLLVVVWSIFSGLSTNASAAVTKPETNVLKIGITQEFDTLNLINARMLVSRYVYNFVNRTLVTLDLDSRWIPLLITKIPTLENGLARFEGQGAKRHVVADFEIKPDLFWGDGTPVTAKDVKLAWEVALSKYSTVAELEAYAQVKSIVLDPKDEKKFTFVYNEARFNFSYLGEFIALPAHIEGPIFKKFGNRKEGYLQNTEYATNPTNPGLYMGPYVVTEFKHCSHVVLERNPQYKSKPAKIAKIILKVIPNTNTLESNLRSGAIDMVSIFGFTLDQALAFERKAKSTKMPYSVVYQPSLVYEHIDLNLENKILQDKNVRKALVYAIDREALTKALFEGKQKPAVHNLAPMDPWFTDDPQKIVVYEASKRRAKALLEDAGWKVNAEDGFRYKNGERLSLSLMTTAGNKVRELVQVYLKNEWKKVGVDIQIKNEPARVYFGETIRKSTFDAMAMYAWTSLPEADLSRQFHSRSIPTEKNAFSGNNTPKWSNAEVDALLDNVLTEFDFGKRKQAMTKFLYLYTDEVPVIPLYYRSDVSVVPNNLKGHAVSPHAFPATNFVENWELL